MRDQDSQKLLTERIKAKAKALGFDPVGIAKVPGSSRIKLRTKALEKWLNAGYHAEMKWMEAPRRKNIETLLEGVQSVIAVGLNYFVDKKPDKKSLLIGRYAWGSDYHKTIEKRLKLLGKVLELERPGCKWKVCVDSTSLLEKAWAEEAGLGWIGKHTNLINKNNGSWMVLGYLLCTETLLYDEPSKPLCGKCKKCLDACPTKAITEPFVVDSNLCLSYHTIENRDIELPQNIKNSMGRWVAGCDICQDICPWNKKKIPSSKDPAVQPKEWVLNLKKHQIMEWNEKEWEKNLQNSALKRIKPWMWKRNAKEIKINY